MSERAADRDVDEQQTKRGISEFRGGKTVVEFFGEEQRRDGHRCRLGDEGTEQRTERENRKPPGAYRMAADAGKKRHDRLRENKHRPACRDGHDDEDEKWLGEMETVEMVNRALPAVKEDHSEKKGDNPEAEHDFDLAEEMEHFGFEGDFVASRGSFSDFGNVAAAQEFFAMFFFKFVRQLHELRREERVDDREREDGSAEVIERGVRGGERCRGGALSRCGEDRYGQ